MKDELIGFETAKLAKEKGFKEFCSNGFDDRLEGIEPFGIGNGEISSTHSIDYFDNKGDNHLYARPTQSLLQRWMREVHNIKISILPRTNIEEKRWWDWLIQGQPVIYLKFTSYEKALEEGLQEALKLIIKK